jgi:hypothetical protein
MSIVDARQLIFTSQSGTSQGNMTWRFVLPKEVFPKAPFRIKILETYFLFPMGQTYKVVGSSNNSMRIINTATGESAAVTVPDMAVGIGGAAFRNTIAAAINAVSGTIGLPTNFIMTETSIVLSTFFNITTITAARFGLDFNVANSIGVLLGFGYLTLTTPSSEDPVTKIESYQGIGAAVGYHFNGSSQFLYIKSSFTDNVDQAVIPMDGTDSTRGIISVVPRVDLPLFRDSEIVASMSINASAYSTAILTGTAVPPIDISFAVETGGHIDDDSAQRWWLKTTVQTEDNINEIIRKL